MWREGGMRPSSEEHHFTSLSFNFLSLPSVSAPFIRSQVVFTRLKNVVKLCTGSGNVFVFDDFVASERLFSPSVCHHLQQLP